MDAFRKLFRKIFSDRTKTDFPGGCIPHRYFMERIDSGPILIVGDYMDRDYSEIKKKFQETYLLDVTDTGIASGKYFICQSVTDPIPFPDKYFKNILIAEVIEHVWEDKKALTELRRVLTDDGKLLLSVPLYHDHPEEKYHYHIYSPKTIAILLEHSGFDIIEKNYRGFILAYPQLTAFMALLTYPFFGKEALRKINSWLYKIHLATGNRPGINSWFRFRHVLKGYGVAIVAKKSHNVPDATGVQKNFFTNKRKMADLGRECD